MVVVGVILGFLVIVAIMTVYSNWLTKGIQPREVKTMMSDQQIHDSFATKVGGKGWKVIDDDNPMIAQSPVLAGRRQQIAAEILTDEGGRTVKIWVPRVWMKRGTPYKSHTLRIRMNSFARAIGQSGTAA